MHKVYFDLLTMMTGMLLFLNSNVWFGNEWRGQRGIRKKFKRTEWLMEPQRVWFLIPDPAFKTL